MSVILEKVSHFTPTTVFWLTFYSLWTFGYPGTATGKLVITSDFTKKIDRLDSGSQVYASKDLVSSSGKIPVQHHYSR